MENKNHKCNWCLQIGGKDYGKTKDGYDACSKCADNLNGKIAHKPDYDITTHIPFSKSIKKDNKEK